jgi:RNA polymerase sigma factor (sigma-70 family)
MMDGKRRDWELLREFVDDNSQEAFREITGRYLGLVMSTALRELCDRELAEDVAQAVFLILARKAHTFHSHIVLAAWLFDTCKFTARNARRDERRRMMRERKIASEVEKETGGRTGDATEIEDPALNEALGGLPKGDREAVLLRYVCGYTFVETGEACGMSEEAARKRVGRALEKLRRALTRGGLTVTAAAITTLLQRQSAEAATAALEAKIATLIITPAAVGLAGGSAQIIAQGAMNTMRILHMKIAVFAACGMLVAGVAAYQAAAGPAGPAGPARPVGPPSQGILTSTPKPPPPAPDVTVIPGTEAQAVKLFRQMIDAYAAAKTLSFTEKGEGIREMGFPYTMHFTFQQPEKYEIRVTRNGRTTRVIYQEPKALSIPLDDPGALTTFDIPPGYTPMRYGLEKAADVELEFSLFFLVASTREQFTKSILDSKEPRLTMLMGTPSVIDEARVDNIILRSNAGGKLNEIFLSLGHDDHLPRRYIQQSGAPGYYTVAYTDVRVNQPVAPETFTLNASGSKAP